MCLLYDLTGWFCPGCGGTRALFALLELDIYQAFRYNMYAVFVIPMYILLSNLSKRNKWLDISFMVITIAFTLLRNVGPLSTILEPTLVR